MHKVLLAATAAAHVTFGAAVQAATVDPSDPLGLLKSFNTIALGDLNASSETQGTVFVGGDLHSNGYTVSPDSEPEVTLDGVTGSLIVGGNVGGGSVNVNDGNVRVGGSGTVNVNDNDGIGATLETGVSGIPVAEVTATLKQLSQNLAALGDTPGGVVNGSDQNDLSFVSGPGGTGALEGIAVLSTDRFFFDGGTFKGLTSDDGVTTMVNVAGIDVTIQMNTNAIFDNLLVNFYEATSLNIQAGVGFSILAPLADITVTGGGVNGTVVGSRITQWSEIRTTFNGDLPEDPPAIPLPAGVWLLAAGLAGLGIAGRRRAA